MAKRKVDSPPAKQQGKKRAVTKRQPTASGPDAIYQVKITLNGIKPPIWRRFQVRDCTLAELHDVIQTCMGWEDEHLHCFMIGSESYGLPDQWTDPSGYQPLEVIDSRKVKLRQLVSQGVKKIRYDYDMGDSWEHTVLIEKTVPEEAGAHYPRCTDGKRACPPEDCGGIWGYMDLLEILQDPDDPAYEERIEWLGGEIDPEVFDIEEVNHRLR